MKSDSLLANFLPLVCLAVAATAAVQAQQSAADPLHVKIKTMEAEIREWERQGRNLAKVAAILPKIQPLLRQGKRGEAEKLVDRIRGILATPLEPFRTNWEPLEKYRRITEETQYLIFPIREVRNLWGGHTERLSEALGQMETRLGKPENRKRRNWGFHLMIPAWRIGEKAVPVDRAIAGAVEVALQTSVAFYITAENLEWSPRPDLWNYDDPEKPGYDPANAANVEWMDWDGAAHPHRYRNWGRPEQMPPVICYNSPAVLREVSRLAHDCIAPPLRAGIDRLEREGKSHLFGGLTVGAEPALPNYENIAQRDPAMAAAMERDGVPRVRLGYNALSNLGYSADRPPADFGVALAEVNRAFVGHWAKELARGGVPTHKMYTHVAAGAGVPGSPGVGFTNAPISIAFIEHARPGWTTYPEGPLHENFALLYEQLKQNGDPHWASTEASPSGLQSGGVQMSEYLRWHFDFGATVMVFNVGATSEELSGQLEAAVWGEAALEAYREFLRSES